MQPGYVSLSLSAGLGHCRVSPHVLHNLYPLLSPLWLGRDVKQDSHGPCKDVRAVLLIGELTSANPDLFPDIRNSSVCESVSAWQKLVSPPEYTTCEIFISWTRSASRVSVDNSGYLCGTRAICYLGASVCSGLAEHVPEPSLV